MHSLSNACASRARGTSSFLGGTFRLDLVKVRGLLAALSDSRLSSIIEAIISRRCSTLSRMGGAWERRGTRGGSGGADGVPVDGVGVGVSGAMQGLGKKNKPPSH